MKHSHTPTTAKPQSNLLSFGNLTGLRFKAGIFTLALLLLPFAASAQQTQQPANSRSRSGAATSSYSHAQHAAAINSAAPATAAPAAFRLPQKAPAPPTFKALVYVDFVFIDDGLVTALTNLGYSVSTASGWADFCSRLDVTDFDIAVGFAQDAPATVNGLNSVAVQNYIAAGGRFIFTTWAVDGIFSNYDIPLLALFDAEYTGNHDLTTVTVNPLYAEGITNPFTLINYWGSYFSIGLRAINGAEVLATFDDNGDAAIVRGNGGRTLMLGYMSDCPPAAINVNLFTNIVKMFAPDFDIDKSGTHTFSPQLCGYTPAPVGVTVTNIGGAAVNLTVSLKDGAAFTVTQPSVNPLNVAGSTTFTVAPKSGLSVGTYTDSVFVSDAVSGITEKFEVSFTVVALPPAEINCEICYGTSYSDNIFTTPISEAGTYRAIETLPSGCQREVTLYLTVVKNPMQEVLDKLNEKIEDIRQTLKAVKARRP
ncbi:MAG: hypothetical protein LBN23_01415 [Paludibacter sp.]|jgi:hypothetical protein|nr:hypothetical protein [Paludibacter sp.]